MFVVTRFSWVLFVRLTNRSPMQDGVVPQLARDYIAPHYPFFHPKDQQDLASAVTDGMYFSFYDFSRRTWIRTDVPRRIDGTEGSELHIRAPTVTNCPGLPSIPFSFLPSTPRKRSADDSDPAEDSFGASKLSRSSSSSSFADARCVFLRHLASP